LFFKRNKNNAQNENKVLTPSRCPDSFARMSAILGRLEVAKIRKAYRPYRSPTITELAKKYEVSTGTIYKIVKFKPPYGKTANGVRP